MVTRLVLRAILLSLLTASALAVPAQADTPPAPTCFYEVAGCDPVYGTVSSSTLRTVAVDETVTIGAPQNPNPPFGVAFPEGCVPDAFHICLYSNVAWKFTIPAGHLSAPVQITDGCTAEKTFCTFVYRPRGIGIDGDFWQTIVAANQIGSTTIQAKQGYGFYARPKWRWVQFNSSGATNWPAGIAYAVRSGTTPTWGSCVEASTIFSTTATTADCIKATGTLTPGKDPQWRMPLPANSSWKVLFSPFQRGEAGPAAIPPAQENWVAQTVNVAESDITRTVTPRARGTLTATLDVGGPSILLGQSRTVTLKATATGGAVQSAGFQAGTFGRTAGTSVGISYVNDDAGISGKTLLPGESVTATGKITGDALTPPLSTLRGQAVWRSPTSGSTDQKATATADVTVYKDTVPPPPTTGGDSTVPKPPNPGSATTGAVTGTVADGPKTTYRVLWYAAPACDTEDAGARFAGLKDVTTDDAGNGDASAAFTSAVAAGEAVFGYSTLGGKRSKRSVCVIASGDPPLSGGGGPIILTAPPPKTTTAPKVTLTLVGASFKHGRKATLKLKVPAPGKVELRRGTKRFAKAVAVKKGVAAFKVRFARKGKVKLTAVFTPAGGGAKVTQPLTITVT